MTSDDGRLKFQQRRMQRQGRQLDSKRGASHLMEYSLENSEALFRLILAYCNSLEKRPSRILSDSLVRLLRSFTCTAGGAIRGRLASRLACALQCYRPDVSSFLREEADRSEYESNLILCRAYRSFVVADKQNADYQRELFHYTDAITRYTDNPGEVAGELTDIIPIALELQHFDKVTHYSRELIRMGFEDGGFYLWGQRGLLYSSYVELRLNQTMQAKKHLSELLASLTENPSYIAFTPNMMSTLKLLHDADEKTLVSSVLIHCRHLAAHKDVKSDLIAATQSILRRWIDAIKIGSSPDFDVDFLR